MFWMCGGQAVAADLQLMKGLAERLKQCHDPTWNHDVRALWFECVSQMNTDFRLSCSVLYFMSGC